MEGAVENVETEEDWRAVWRQSIDIYKPLVVGFVASWCTKCKQIGPEFGELCKKYPALYFATVDVDVLPDITAQWDVKRVPTFVFIRGGKLLDSLVTANIQEVDSKAASYVPQAPP